MVGDFERLALAHDHIMLAQGHIDQQHQRIQQLHERGQDVVLAEALLRAMESTLQSFEAHRRIIEQRINDEV